MRLLLIVGLLGCAPKSESGIARVDGPRPTIPMKVTPILFWEVEKGGVVNHMLGTCHMGTSLDDALPPPHRNHLDDARVVVTEAEIPEDPMVAMQVLVSDTRLSTRVSPEAFHRLVSRTPQLPATLFDRVQPWGAAIISSSASAILQGGKRGMDREVVERGTKAGAKRMYVETLEEQAALMASFNGEFLKAMEQVPSAESERAVFSELDQLCREGVVPADGQLIDDADPTTEALLYARNRAWVPKLLPELAQGRTFVAVGAAHMFGKEGLIELLEAEGYTITQRSAERRVAPPGAYEPPAPPTPYDPVRAGQIASHLSGVIDTACAPEGAMLQCFFDTDAQCRETLTADLALCADQHTEWPTSGAVEVPTMVEASTCMVTGVLVEGLSRPVRPAPVCQMMSTMMRAGSGGK